MFGVLLDAHTPLVLLFARLKQRGRGAAAGLVLSVLIAGPIAPIAGFALSTPWKHIDRYEARSEGPPVIDGWLQAMGGSWIV